MNLRSLTTFMFIVVATSAANALTVTFKTGEDQYLYAMGGGGYLVGLQESPDNYSQFEVLDQNGGRLMSGDKVCIKTYGGAYLAATNGGGGPLYANSGSCNAWEKFRLIRVGEDGRSKSGVLRTPSSVAFQSDRGLYVNVKPDGSFEVTNRTIKSDSIFEMDLD